MQVFQTLHLTDTRSCWLRLLWVGVLRLVHSIELFWFHVLELGTPAAIIMPRNYSTTRGVYFLSLLLLPSILTFSYEFKLFPTIFSIHYSKIQ